MARRFKSKPHRDEADGSERLSAGTATRRRWQQVLIWGLALAVAAVAVEWWTRPVEPFLSDDPRRESARTEPAAPPPPERPADIPADAATTEQCIAEGKQIADRLAEAFPEDPQALTLGAQLHFAFGNSTKAVEWWEKSLQLNPQLAEAWCGLAAVRWERGDFELAVTCMRRVQESNPKLADERIFVLVDSLMNLGRDSEAIASLESRARVSPLSPSGRLVLGQAYLQAEEYEKAQREFEAALAVEPSLASGHYGLAEALTALGQIASAQQHRGDYARLKQQDLAVYDRLRGAGREMEKVNPAEVRGLVGRFCLCVGELYAAHGRRREAEWHWRQAQRLDPRNPAPRQLLDTLDSGQTRTKQ